MKQLAACIDKGIASVAPQLDEVKGYVKDLHRIHDTLDPKTASTQDRQAAFLDLITDFRASSSPIYQNMAGVMDRFAPGLFVDCGDDLPADNLDLERHFRIPKAHERRIHGHAHAGVRIVEQGPTLLPTLDAHLRHPVPFTAEELIPTLHASPPPCQRETESRRRIMRRARSTKKRPLLLAELEKRYETILGS